MDVERVRDFLRQLPLVEETMQWGDNLVFWVGDKALGGKMFALVGLDGEGKAVLSFAAGQERFHELVENDGVIPAPYFARIYWVALERWNAIPAKDLQQLLRDARDLTCGKLPKRTKEILALPAGELEKLLKVKKKLLARKAEEQAAAKTAAKSAKKRLAKLQREPPKKGPRSR
jgi:predicted DNA-binding protein (MmcQ/YjbR family)